MQHLRSWAQAVAATIPEMLLRFRPLQPRVAVAGRCHQDLRRLLKANRKGCPMRVQQ